eukprot:ctg_2675.g586
MADATTGGAGARLRLLVVSGQPAGARRDEMEAGGHCGERARSAVSVEAVARPRLARVADPGHACGGGWDGGGDGAAGVQRSQLGQRSVAATVGLRRFR